MSERIVSGLGLALLDVKFLLPQKSQTLPREINDFLRLLDSAENVLLTTGGVVPNILTAMKLVNPKINLRVFCSLGQDKQGDFYQQKVEKQLGKLQRVDKLPTGMVGFLVDNNSGIKLDMVPFYLAAERATVPLDQIENQPGELFVSTAGLFAIANLKNELHKTLEALSSTETIFAINLSGVRHGGMDYPQLMSELITAALKPQVVFGNADEIRYATGQDDLTSGVSQLIPQARLLIATDGNRGAKIRFEGQVFNMEANPANDKLLLDSTGAGDCFMGVMLAQLIKLPFSRWHQQQVQQAANIASFAAARIVENPASQLQKTDLPAINEFIRLQQLTPNH